MVLFLSSILFFNPFVFFGEGLYFLLGIDIGARGEYASHLVVGV